MNKDDDFDFANFEIKFEDIDEDVEQMDQDEEVPDIEEPEDEWEEEEAEEEEAEEEGSSLPLLILGGVIALLALLCIGILLMKHAGEKEEIPVVETQTYMEEETDTQTQEDFILQTEESIPQSTQEPEETTVVSKETDWETEVVIQPEIPQQPDNADQPMEFSQVNDTVTAKDVTNLRSTPGPMDENTVVGQLMNGETLARTGINETYGWSRLEYDGQIVYAVTNFLTTDLSYKTPVVAQNPNRVSTQDGRIIVFTDCNDMITPKEYVNLRTEPSTSEGDTTVRCQINHGETLHRTGYSQDSGWSRVEYNGEVLYVVSSMVTTAE